MNITKKQISKIIEAASPYIEIDLQAVMDVALSPENEADTWVQIPYPINGKGLLVEAIFKALETNSVGVDPTWTRRVINQIHHKESKSGNPTWYCYCGDVTVYIRQSNKDSFVAIYPEIEAMNIGDTTSECDIVIYTSKEGDFHKIEAIETDGRFTFAPNESDSQRKARIASKLSEIMNSDRTPLFLDFETTGLDEESEIVEYAIKRLKPFEFSESGYIMPQNPDKLSQVGKNGKSPQDIHELSHEALIEKNAKTFPEIYDAIAYYLKYETVITYGDFDKRLLEQVCNRHGLPMIECNWVNLIELYAEYNGERGWKGWKWIPLSKAYENITGQELLCAHAAMCDVEAMIEIVELITKP